MRDSPDYGDERHRRKRQRSRSPSHRRSYSGDRPRDGGNPLSSREVDRPYRRRSRSRSQQGYRNGRRDRTDRVRDDRKRSLSPQRKSNGPLPSQDDSFRNEIGAPAQPQKEKPNFKPTGLLAKEANTVAGTTTVLKYHEPPEGRKPPPSQQWRMYVFEGKDLVDTVYLFERSCWLIGRDPKVTDLRLDHVSISKQHAVIQFRHSSTISEYGDKINRVKPYLIDLESANGTSLNEKKIAESRYVELVDGDVVSFGHSDREYVMMLPKPEKK